MLFEQNMSIPDMNSTLGAPSMKWIRDVERFYAFPALSQAVKLYADNVSTALSAVQSIRVVALVFFLLLTACMYFFYFRPLVWQVQSLPASTIVPVSFVQIAAFQNFS